MSQTVIMDEVGMQRAIARIAHEVIEKNEGCYDVCVVGIQRRGGPSAQMLCRGIENFEGVCVPQGTLDITFCRDDVEKAFPEPKLTQTALPFDVTGKRVLLVDDVILQGARRARRLMRCLPKREGKPRRRLI